MRLRDQEMGYLFQENRGTKANNLGLRYRFQENMETKVNTLGLGYREHTRFRKTLKQMPIL